MYYKYYVFQKLEIQSFKISKFHKFKISTFQTSKHNIPKFPKNMVHAFSNNIQIQYNQICKNIFVEMNGVSVYFKQIFPQ